MPRSLLEKILPGVWLALVLLLPIYILWLLRCPYKTDKRELNATGAFASTCIFWLAGSFQKALCSSVTRWLHVQPLGRRRARLTAKEPRCVLLLYSGACVFYTAAILATIHDMELGDWLATFLAGLLQAAGPCEIMFSWQALVLTPLLAALSINVLLGIYLAVQPAAAQVVFRSLPWSHELRDVSGCARSACRQYLHL